MLFWSMGQELKRVPNGKKHTMICGRCHHENIFYESVADDSFKAFFVVELWKRTKRVMQCGECLGVCDYYSVYPEEKKLAEEAAQQVENERRQKEEEALAKQREQEEKERAKQDEIDRKRREEEKQRKSEELDDELEKLKKKMGL